jgi:hypothetical protein
MFVLLIFRFFGESMRKKLRCRQAFPPIFASNRCCGELFQECTLSCTVDAAPRTGIIGGLRNIVNIPGNVNETTAYPATATYNLSYQVHPPMCNLFSVPHVHPHYATKCINPVKFKTKTLPNHSHFRLIRSPVNQSWKSPLRYS